MARVDTDSVPYAVLVTRAQLAERRGRLIESRRLCEAALHRLAEAADKGDACNLLRCIARTHRRAADQEITLECAEAALAVAEAHADAAHAARIYRELGELHCRQGRNRDALRCLERARALFARLHARRELADVVRRTARLQDEFLGVARRWSQSIECNDDYTQGHCERVADIACALAEADGMDERSLFWFRIGALLHDVGKLVVPAEVLNKRGTLTAEEWALVRSHPTAGAEMLAQVEFPWDVRPIVEAHHERWDGGGYPYGLAGEEIPRDARIVCIADVYDALTSARSYKCAMSHDDAMAVMRADAGTQFDPALFALFERVAAGHAEAWAREASAGRPRPRQRAARGLTPSPAPARARARRRAAAPVARAGRPSRRPP